MISKLFQKNRRRNSEPAAVQCIPQRYQNSIDSKLRQSRMLDTSPLNIYGNTSMDHGYETGPSVDNSRRSSFGIREAPNNSRRRYTMQSRLQIQRPTYDNVRKTSYQMTPMQNINDNDDEMRPMPLNRRRMSVPENVFRRCDFAIMRPIRMFAHESSYEIVSAFGDHKVPEKYRHSDPYQTFMKSITCYDLSPIHCSVVVFDVKTKVKVAVNALSQHGHQAAMVVDTDNHISECVFDANDCLTAIRMVVSGDKDVANKSVIDFLRDIGSSALICSGASKSVWEASQIVSLNRLGCIPIFDTTSPKPATPLFFLTTRLILQETVLKLTDFGDAILLHVRQATLEQKKIGTWSDIIKLHQDTTIENAISIFVARKHSCIPVVNNFDQFVGMITRKDLISEIMGQQSGSYTHVLKQSIKTLPSMRGRPLYGNKRLTVFETVARLINTDKNCLPIVDDSMQIEAMVSYGDILSYIQNSSTDRTPSEDQSSTDSSNSINRVK